MSTIHFFTLWILLNVLGFVGGSLLGATSVGWIPKIISGTIGVVLGDLVFGATIGFFQWLVLKRYSRVHTSAWWILCLSLGFTFGARLGAFLTYRIAGDWLSPSMVFGVFMGGSTGMAVLPILWKWSSGIRLAVWVAVSVLAWILGESIAFSTGFSQGTVPYVALVISFCKGLGLIWLEPSRNGVSA